MINLLVLSNSFPNKDNNNAGIFVQKQLQSLPVESFSITVINPIPYSFMGKGSVDSRRNGNINIYYPKYRHFRGPFGFILTNYFFYKSVEKAVKLSGVKPNVIHANWLVPSGYSGTKLAKQFKVPLVCTARGSDVNVYPHKYFFAKYFITKVLYTAKSTICVSEAIKTSIISKFGLDENMLRVIYNGIDSNEKLDIDYNNSYYKKMFANQENVKRILFIGNLKRTKGIYELLDAFKLVTKKIENVHLVIVGQGKEEKRIKSRISKYKLNHQVHMIGEVPHDKIQYWYELCDFLVLPSYSEGLPNVILESLMLKRRVLATNVGGVSEVITPFNGLLLKNYSVNMVYKGLIEMLGIIDDYGKECLQCRVNVKSKFSRTLSTKKLIELYDNVLRSEKDNG